MRQAVFLASWRRRLAVVIVAGHSAFTGLGCHQYYYYSGDPCAPAPVTSSAVKGGPICEVPTQVVEGGTALSEGSSRATTVTGAAPTTAPRVVVSEPYGQGQSRVSWRRSDPDASAPTTIVNGNIDGSSVNR